MTSPAEPDYGPLNLALRELGAGPDRPDRRVEIHQAKPGANFTARLFEVLEPGTPDERDGKRIAQATAKTRDGAVEALRKAASGKG